MIPLLAQAPNPIVRWEYFIDEWDQIQRALIEHLELTVYAVILGLVVSAGLSAIALRYRWTAAPINGFTAFLYTIPSVALFGILVPYFGLSRLTAVLPLAAYTLLILVTNIVAGFNSVSPEVREAADGMGMTPARRVLHVELPLAMPYIVDGSPHRRGLDGGARDGRCHHRSRWSRASHSRRAASNLLDADDHRCCPVDPARFGARWADPWCRQVAHSVGPARKECTVTVLAQAPVPRDIGVFEWLLDPDSWTGADGILVSLADTVILCAVVVVVAIITMVPLASWLAHTRRGEVSVSWMVTLSRAIPTFAVAGLLVPISLRSGWGFEPWPIFIALLLLALPPIFLNTYTAIQQVDPGVVDAARAMGYSETNVLVPCGAGARHVGDPRRRACCSRHRCCDRTDSCLPRAATVSAATCATGSDRTTTD